MIAVIAASQRATLLQVAGESLSALTISTLRLRVHDLILPGAGHRHLE